MNSRNWYFLCELNKTQIPRKHKFYCWDKLNNSLNTFTYKFELTTFLKMNENENWNLEIGKISMFNVSNDIVVNFYDHNSQLQKITFTEFEQVISFAKNKNFKIKNIEFVYEENSSK